MVFLLPGAVAGFLIALLSGRFIDRYGARPVLVVATVAGIAGFLFIALAHSQPWQVIVAGILANAYISLGYGALPALVVGEAEAGETAVATSINAIARTVGSSTAAAVVAVLLGPIRDPAGEQLRRDLPRGAATAALAMVLIALSRPQRREPNPSRHSRIPGDEPRVGLTQRRKIGHRLANVGLDDLGDQLPHAGIEQTARQVGDDAKRRPGVVVIDPQRQRDTDSAAAPPSTRSAWVRHSR